MRLGRSIAALGGALALVAAGAALASPVAADESGLHLDKGDVIRTAPDKPVTVTGTGCAPVNGKPSTVTWAVFTPKEAAKSVAEGAVTAKEDGTWSVDLDIPGIVKDKGLSDPSAGVVNFGCMNYNNETTSGEQADLEIDSTDVEGKAAIVSSDTDGDGKYDAQSFDINFTGFSPGRLVDITVINADITKNETWEVATVTADADGRVTYRGPVPAGPRNDQYYLQVWEAAYYEGYVSKPIQVKDGWWQVDGENIPVDPGKPAPTAAPSAPADPNGTATADPNGTGTATADPASAPKSGLAKTGASLGLAVVAAGLLAAGGIVLFHRRRV